MGTYGILLLASILLQEPDNPATLQIRVIEGEGAAYPLGGRATRGVTVQVSDQTGKPVEGVAVSFRLPDEGPSGTFSSGSRAEIATTKADGRASAWGMQWNRIEGPFEIRITAAKGQARAGTVCAVVLSKATMANDSPAPIKLARSHKWLWVSLAVVGGAGVAVALAALTRKSSVPAGTATTPTISAPTVAIGPP